MRRKTAALAVSKSAQISKLLGEGLETKEIIAKGFNPGLVYQVKSKKNGRKAVILAHGEDYEFRSGKKWPSTVNEHERKLIRARQPITLIVNGLEVTIANGTAEQVGRIAAALIS